MSALPKRFFTPEEYLTLEVAADYRSQYVDGEIFAMAGAQPWHIDVTGNLIVALRTRFQGRPCKVYFDEMRVRSQPGNLWTYPDVVALCGKPLFDTDQDPYTLLNPQVIFEVLSPSTETFDRGEKFRRYRQLESLTDYVLVSSYRRRVDHYRVQENGIWICEEYTNPKGHFRLASLGCELPLAEIYEGVTFPDLPDR